MSETIALPHDIQAEQALLGAMILESKAIALAASNIDKTAFYKLSHQKIFQAIIDCSDDGQQIEVIVLSNRLKSSGLLEKIGGNAYLRELIDACVNPANVDMYLNITKDKAIRRKLIAESMKIQKAAHNEAADIHELTAELKSLSNTSVIQDKVARVSDFIPAADRRLEGKSGDFIPTGNEAYDRDFGGFELGEYIVLSGFSGMGKTSYMNQCLISAVEEGIPVGVFSSEISGARLCINLARTMSGEYINARSDGTMSEEASNAWQEAKELMQMDGFQYYLNDQASIYIEDLHRVARKMVSEHDVKLIGIDHLQRLRSRQNYNSEALRMKEISNRACEMARELDIVVVMLSQKTKGEGFQLRYATELFNDADKILDLGQVHTTEIEDEPVVCERYLSEKKGRNYGTCKLQGSFNKPGLRFDAWCRIH